MPSRSRRAFLAAAGVATLAGCAQSGVNSGDGGHRYTLDTNRIGDSLAPLSLWTPREDPPPWADPVDAVDAAVAGERPTAYGTRPVPDDEYVERDGTYYRLSVVTTGLSRIERPVLTLEWVGDVEELADPPEYVRHADLPRLDRRAVKPAYFAARAREFDGSAPWDIVEQGGYVYRHHDQARSELAPEPEHDHVLFNDTVLAVTVETHELAEPAYTGVAVQVADSETAFERALDGERVDARLDSADLSADQRLMIEREQYEETTPLSEGYRALIEALGLHDLLSVPDGDAPRAENGRHLALDDVYYRYGLYVNPSN